MQEKEYTVIWNKHGDGSLIGIFDNEDLIKKITKLISENDQSSYISLFKAKINEINKHALTKDFFKNSDL